MWRKSSRSNGTEFCVEVEMDWRKARKCESHACVEVKFHTASRCETANCLEVGVGDAVFVRDSKDPDGPVLAFDRGAWGAFVRSL